MKPRFQQSILLAVLLSSIVVPACSRRHYRIRADQDAYELLAEKSVGTPWQPPNDYSVYPAADSRLADPSNPDWPLLPEPGPTLHEEFVSDDPEAESIERPDPEMPPLDPGTRTTRARSISLPPAYLLRKHSARCARCVLTK